MPKHEPHQPAEALPGETEPILCLCECLEELLKRPVLDVALRQRAKFEGWLKVELAYALEQRGATVILEAEVPGVQGHRFRADIRAKFPEGTMFIMLKTNNASFCFPGIAPRTRPVSRNFMKTAEDIDKLRPCAGGSSAFVVFPFFPVSSSAEKRADQVRPHLTRLLEGCRARLVREGFVIPPSSPGAWGIAWYIISPERLPMERRES